VIRHHSRPRALLLFLSLVILLGGCALPWGRGTRSPPQSQAPLSHQPIYVTNANAVYAVDSADGRVIWRTPVARYDSPIVIGSTQDAVFVVLGNFGDRRLVTLLILRASDGTLVSRYPNLQVVALSHGLALLEAYPDNCQHDADCHVEAIDATTGTFLWKVAISGTLDWRADSFGGTVVLPIYGYAPLSECLGHGIYNTRQVSIEAVDAHSGALRWSISNPPGTLDSLSLQLEQGTLYWAADEISPGCMAPVMRLHATDLNTGSPLWTHDVDEGFTLGGVARGIIYGTSSLGTFAYRASDGTVLWQSREHGDGYLQITTHTVSLYKLHGPTTVLDAATGAVLWSVPGFVADEYDDSDGLLLGEVSGSNASDPLLEARDELSGSLRWSVSLPVSYPMRVMLAGGSAIVVQRRWNACEGLSSNVSIVAYDLAKGHMRWTRTLAQEDATPTPSAVITATSTTSYVPMALRC
jgi:outer membrane protein assembly factor BamB